MRRAFLASLLCASLLVGALIARAYGSGVEQQEPGEAHLLFMGDLMVGRYVGSSMAAYGYDAPFAEVKGLVSSADIAVGNLEGPILPTGAFTPPRPYPNLLNLSGDARAAGAISRAGIDLLSVANNHSYDAKLDRLRATLAALRNAGITPIGLDGANGQNAVVRETHGLKIAFLAYTSVLNAWLPKTAGMPFISYLNPTVAADRERLAREVARARQGADLVVVVMHWGAEYALQPNSAQRQLAQVAASAGADLVVGSHPHVAQGIETLNPHGRSTLVAYSLGNALFDQVAKLETRQGLALECTVDRNGIKSARLIPLETRSVKGSFVMQIADNASGQLALARAALSTPANLQWKAIWELSQPQPGIALAYNRPVGAAQTSEADLGIGSPATVELRNGSLSVSVKDPSGALRTVWKSEPDWRVTGYTIGDADADGRLDLVYTLWKRSLVSSRPVSGGLDVNRNGGIMLPHLYINGWRQGTFRPLWHGSPRPAPLLSVAVAPIGKARKQLLATLESSDPTKEKAPGRISIWEWTGGFGYELTSAIRGVYSEMWSDGKVLVFR